MKKEIPSSNFDYTAIPLGFYDEIYHRKKGMRSFWHFHKFERVKSCILPHQKNLLDIGCFCGTFLSTMSEMHISSQVGVDILSSQIEYAQKEYGTSFRQFIYLKDFSNYNQISNNRFDYVTAIEIIEHLTSQEIFQLLSIAHEKLKIGGKLIITTPNYSSFWPILEWILNKISDVKYEEQHISKFDFFKFKQQINRIMPDFDSKFTVSFKTSTHLVSPFFALFSFKLAHYISKYVPANRWRNPLGSLLLIVLEKK